MKFKPHVSCITALNISNMYINTLHKIDKNEWIWCVLPPPATWLLTGVLSVLYSINCNNISTNKAFCFQVIQVSLHTVIQVSPHSCKHCSPLLDGMRIRGFI